jgi:hypothetical protein
MVAHITRQRQLHELPRRSQAAGPRKRHAGDQAGDPELPPGAIRKRNEFVHVLSHQSPDDIEAAPNELIRQLKGNGLAVRTILAEKLFLDRLFRGFGNEGVTETGATLGMRFKKRDGKCVHSCSSRP